MENQASWKKNPQLENVSQGNKPKAVTGVIQNHATVPV
jgi:hypothetical protein